MYDDRCSNVECNNFQSISKVITDKVTGKKYCTFVCGKCSDELDEAYGVEDIPFEEALNKIVERKS
jgi:predicted metal-binding protein